MFLLRWMARICRKICRSRQSGLAIRLFQAPREISFTFHFWHVFHSSLSNTCGVIRQQFWMKESDILGSQNILWPSYIFPGDQHPPAPGSAPLTPVRITAAMLYFVLEYYVIQQAVLTMMTAAFPVAFRCSVFDIRLYLLLLSTPST